MPSALPPLPYSIKPSTATGLIGNTATIVADLGRPTVEAFIAANQNGFPATEAPQIPDAASAHPLFESLNAAIALIVGNVDDLVELGSIIFPKTMSVDRMQENFALFDFALSADDMAQISRLNRDDRTGPNPDAMSA